MPMVTRLWTSVAALFVGTILATVQAQTELGEAHVILQRSKAAMGVEHAGSRILHIKFVQGLLQDYQSDRTYPPFFSTYTEQESWFDPQGPIERSTGQVFNPGSVSPAPTTISDGSRAATLSRDKLLLIPKQASQSRNLNPWAVVNDFANALDVRASGKERYRDYLRVVLTRRTEDGEQRLLVDEKTGFPVKLDLVQPHYLWGQQHIEYVYSVWNQFGEIYFPAASFRMADGEVNVSRTVAAVDLIERKAAPELTWPKMESGPQELVPLFLRPIPPTAIKVSEHTYVLSNPGYNEVVTLVGNDVYIFDATQSEERARQDGELIEKLFPGKHRTYLVVTDLAWPHVAGLRYWVASGATVISHSAAREFLQKVVDHKWTLAPDTLERSKPRAVFNFVGVDHAYAAHGGAVQIIPIDGIGSEVALMAYLPTEHFLWASDYIQTISEPSLYASEVWKAAMRSSIHPEHFAAEHLPINDWKLLEKVAAR